MNFTYLSAKYLKRREIKAMKYFKLDLLTLLISLFIFSSCQKSDSIALDISPGDTINSSLIDTVSVNTYTVRDDSVYTTSLSQHPFGYFTDPVLGTTESNLAFTLGLPSEGFSFGKEAQLDSAVLVLKYGDEFYGDSLSSAYAINVHQLSEKYINSTGYYSNRKWNYNTAPAGGKVVNRFAWNDSIRVRQIIDGAADTLLKIPPHIRIPMNRNFIESNFINADTSNFKTSAAFRNFFKGLYLTIDKSRSTGAGGIIFFDLATASSSKLEVYYRNKNSSGNPDTNVVSFSITNSGAAANIVHKYEGYPVESKLNKLSDEVYVQALGGLKTKINIPHLEKLKALGNIAINKAELEVSVVGGSDSPFKPAKRLVMYRTDIAGQRQPLPQSGLDMALHPSVIGAVYNSTKKCYVFSIGSYVQSILSGRLKPFDLYIAPIDYTAGTSDYNITTSATTAMRSVLGGKNNSQYKMRINIYYTKPD